MNFDFMAVSDVMIPSLVVRVLDVPVGGLKASMNVVAQIISLTMGMESQVISKVETHLKDGTPALEGEIVLQLRKANQLIFLVLNTLKGNRLISVVLSSVKLRYNETMKQRLQDIAYTLNFEK